jgi:hypothetical protein
MQVMSFFDRKLYTWCFLALGILASVYGALFIQASPAVAIYTWLTCWFLSVFTLMPAEIPENNNLVYAPLLTGFACVSFILLILAGTKDIKDTYA